MRIFVQLGWIQDIINWIFDKILNPIFKWVTDLLSDVFKWLFDNVLGPILEVVFTIVMETVGKLILRLLGRYLYIIEKSLLMILDMMQDMFNVLSGLKPVSDKSLGMENVSLMELLVRSPFLVKSMGIVIMISVVLVFFCAIIATIRSIADMGGQGSQTVSQVMRNLAHALLRMVTAPVMGLFLVLLGNAVLLAITNAMTLGTNASIARTIFVISTFDAVEDEFSAVDKYGNEYNYGVSKRSTNPVCGYNYSTRSEWLASHPGDAADYGLKDKFREPFYDGSKDFMETSDVEKVFNFGRMNFIVGIGGTLLFIYIIGSALFVFVSRMFDILVLLIVEPFFLAPMPLDDGEHFKKWEDMFIAKIFSGYGMVVAMYLYLLICSIVFEGRISFTKGEGIGDIMMDMIMRMVLLYGGAATMMTAGPLVTSILSSTAAQPEGQAFQAGQSFTNTAVMKPLRFATKKLALGGAKALTGGEHGLVGQAEKAIGMIKGGPQSFTRAIKGGQGQGPGGAQQAIPGGLGGSTPPGGPMPAGGAQSFSGTPTMGKQGEGAPAKAAAGAAQGAAPPAGKQMPLDGGAAPNVGTQAFQGSQPSQSHAPAALGGEKEEAAAPAGAATESKADQDDGFETIFDVGGKSLFDEPASDDAGKSSQAAPQKAPQKTAAPRPRAGLGYAWRAKASTATINQVRAKYGMAPLPEKKADSSGGMDMKDIVGGPSSSGDAPSSGQMSMSDIVGGSEAPGKELDMKDIVDNNAPPPG